MNVTTPMNGAVSNQMRAHTMHEKTQIFCCAGDTSSPVLVTNTVWEHVVAIFESIASVMPTNTYPFSDTVKKNEWKFIVQSRMVGRNGHALTRFGNDKSKTRQNAGANVKNARPIPFVCCGLHDEKPSQENAKYFTETGHNGIHGQEVSIECPYIQQHAVVICYVNGPSRVQHHHRDGRFSIGPQRPPV